ncbi:hypothetical protein Q4574_12660 [Aliiglaciecola sp. 3_MG-2023]|uniref:hypothetical protein n=1 Tax=Aliiglaciecola sp. 3_MG-2023 TaxID=3062644 RepID=UPI0026E164B2|nr:hypothetical protein [Aliiglaciecola sp. 3_MG-2023]MDO6694136.1 hypothetical protein [Aliiglaciecola sp. 3_MG-2023]
MKNTTKQKIEGSFVDLGNERFYKIENVDQMPAFFISLISDSDHWLFVSSTGGLTAGRVSPETALFPYVTVDKIHESSHHTGCKTLLKVAMDGQEYEWEPFNYLREHSYLLTRNLYKNTLGNKLRFEEINHSLQMVFRYTWATSEEYGFCRTAEIENCAQQTANIEILDGFLNILPAGTPRYTQSQSSNLVDAYKFNELDEQTGTGIFTLYSGITDRAEPSESLRANVVFCVGLEIQNILLSEQQIRSFNNRKQVETESYCRGIRGAYLVNSQFDLGPSEHKSWMLVANVEQDQKQITALLEELDSPNLVEGKLIASIAAGSDALLRIMASSDGLQQTNEEEVAVHHYANTLFNVLRGGIFNEQYLISKDDFVKTVKTFNQTVYQTNQNFLTALDDKFSVQDLLADVSQQGDKQLQRLAFEYLPITFGRRHGDPSRPWNQFAINLKDNQGNPLLSYQGNWRDIFQNWEALTFSYPQFIESVIAKFLNASTMDGYNPYRITKQGIDWEVEEPDDPWSYIGYWGDHQIIYLLKMLELSKQFHPQKLNQLLRADLFSYANVPYRIKHFEALLANAKDTVSYDEELAEKIAQRVNHMGADGKLVLTKEGEVYQVNLLEKLLVPLLSKLSNLVIDGGIWLNTQRPEWNDANNALVGQGLSMVTLYYIRRYLHFFKSLIAEQQQDFELSLEVNQWLLDTCEALCEVAQQISKGAVSNKARFHMMQRLGLAGEAYRKRVYQAEGYTGKTTQVIGRINELIDDALVAVDYSIQSNRTESGLYHAYNILKLTPQSCEVDHLYSMLEGQVAALSSGAIKGEEAINVLEALFASDVYRPDQNTFMLYPDRQQQRFLNKNTLPKGALDQSIVCQQMLANSDERLILQDSRGLQRFSADLKNANDVAHLIDTLVAEYGEQLRAEKALILRVYEEVFNHSAFTGRSGGMFGFEGLGSIYWHMVSKLLLAVQEQFFQAIQDKQSDRIIQRLGELYYQVRKGIGFNKTPEEYGAFPTDPYSHTPKHAGAQQPGMTGQVKEEVLTRFAEFGLQVFDAKVSFNPALLRSQEFSTTTTEFTYLDVDGQWQKLSLPENSLAFTWCQVPVVYLLKQQGQGEISIHYVSGKVETLQQNALSKQQSQMLFDRSGQIRKIELTVTQGQLFA